MAKVLSFTYHTLNALPQQLQKADESMRASNAHAHEMAVRLEDVEEKNAQLLSYIAKMEAKLNFYAVPAVTPPVVRANSGLSQMSSMVCASEYAN